MEASITMGCQKSQNKIKTRGIMLYCAVSMLEVDLNRYIVHTKKSKKLVVF